jgi:membrane protein
VTEAEALDVLGREEIGRWPSYVQMLEKQNLIKRTDDNNYVLLRNLSQVDFWSFYVQLPYPLPRREDVNHAFDDKWLERIGPSLIESDDYLAAKLAIPLSAIFEEK